MPTVLDPAAETEYLALVRAFPLVSIRDDPRLSADRRQESLAFRRGEEWRLAPRVPSKTGG